MMSLFDTIGRLEERFDELSDLLSQPDVASNPELLQRYGREQAQLSDIVENYRALKVVTAQIAETELMLHDGLDPELQELAREELQTLRAREEEIGERLKLSLIPVDPNDEKDVIVEIRAGTGGDEAGLFAAQLLCTAATPSGIATTSNSLTATGTRPAASKKSSSRSMGAAPTAA